MMTIYTDASVKGDLAVTAYLAIDDTKFFGYKVFIHKKVTTSFHGECLGILDALSDIDPKYLRNATIFTDSQSIIESLVRENRVGMLRVVAAYLRNYDIRIALIRGHQQEHNPNKTVDLICNSIVNSLRGYYNVNKT